MTMNEAVSRYAAAVVRNVRVTHKVAQLRAMAATDVSDEARDEAFDLLDRIGGDALVDEYLTDVTDEATERLLAL